MSPTVSANCRIHDACHANEPSCQQAKFSVRTEVASPIPLLVKRQKSFPFYNWPWRIILLRAPGCRAEVISNPIFQVNCFFSKAGECIISVVGNLVSRSYIDMDALEELNAKQREKIDKREKKRVRFTGDQDSDDEEDNR